VSKDRKKEEPIDDLESLQEGEQPSENLEEEAEGNDQDLEKELAEAREEAAELRDKMLRVAADYENFKKRIEREHLQTMKYAGEQILREMLPVVDNLERAVAQGVVEGLSVEKNLASLQEGVELTLKSLRTSLEKFEVKPIESVGKPFDPNHQEAMTMEENQEIPANHVVTEFEKGYFYKDRLLRAAKVTVSSGKAES
jgi:molecular chaperone GrpE